MRRIKAAAPAPEVATEVIRSMMEWGQARIIHDSEDESFAIRVEQQWKDYYIGCKITRSVV